MHEPTRGEALECHHLRMAFLKSRVQGESLPAKMPSCLQTAMLKQQNLFCSNSASGEMS